MRLPGLALAAFTTIAVLSVACSGTGRPGAHGLGDGAAEGGPGTAGTCGTALSYLGDDDHEFVKIAAPVPTASFVWGFPGSAVAYVGNWFQASSNRSDAFSQTTDPPRDGSLWARGVNGPGLGTGVVLWVQLFHPSNDAVDLSVCSGMTFWARIAAASGQVTVALNDGSRPSGDVDNRSLLPAQSFSLGPAWQEVTLPLPFAPGKVSVATIEFFAGYTGEPVDLQVDDLALICAGACPSDASLD